MDKLCWSASLKLTGSTEVEVKVEVERRSDSFELSLDLSRNLPESRRTVSASCQLVQVKFESYGLWTPECLPILLSNLQRSKHIYRKSSGQLSLGFITYYLSMQNERHCF